MPIIKISKFQPLHLTPKDNNWCTHTIAYKIHNKLNSWLKVTISTWKLWFQLTSSVPKKKNAWSATKTLTWQGYTRHCKDCPNNIRHINSKISENTDNQTTYQDKLYLKVNCFFSPVQWRSIKISTQLLEDGCIEP